MYCNYSLKTRTVRSFVYNSFTFFLSLLIFFFKTFIWTTMGCSKTCTFVSTGSNFLFNTIFISQSISNFCKICMFNHNRIITLFIYYFYHFVDHLFFHYTKFPFQTIIMKIFYTFIIYNCQYTIRRHYFGQLFVHWSIKPKINRINKTIIIRFMSWFYTIPHLKPAYWFFFETYLSMV